MLIKQKSPSLPRNLACRTFGYLPIVFSKGKSAIPPLFNGLELFSASDKAKLFAENFCKNSNLDDSGVSLPVFPCRTNLKLHNISVTPKMVKRVIMNLDLSKTSGPDCIPLVVLRNCEPELSYIPAELFNKCLMESCFIVWISPEPFSKLMEMGGGGGGLSYFIEVFVEIPHDAA